MITNETRSEGQLGEQGISALILYSVFFFLSYDFSSSFRPDTVSVKG